MEYLLWEKNTPGFNEEYGQPAPSLTPFLSDNSDGKKRGALLSRPAADIPVVLFMRENRFQKC